MPAFLQQAKTNGEKFLWLDDSRYSAALLAGGEAPWLDVGGYMAWRQRAQSLLKSDVIALPLGSLFRKWLEGDSSLRAAVSAKRRPNYPLKTFLAGAGFRSHVMDLLTALRARFSSQPLALVCPSPRAWVHEAYLMAFGQFESVTFDQQEVDMATLHCADFLREFGAAGVDTLLLEESVQSEPASEGEVEWYRSVLNVGEHFRWVIGLRVPGNRFVGAPAGSVGYIVAPRPSKAPFYGHAVPREFWDGGGIDKFPSANFRFVEIPLGIPPEMVLDRLAELR